MAQPKEPGSASYSPALPRLYRVEAIHVRVALRRPILDATGEYTHRRSWLLRLVDEDGVEGLGEAALSPVAEDVTTGSLAALIRDIVPALAAGRQPEWTDLASEGEPGRAAMAAVDGAITALLAAHGKASPETVAVSASIRFGGPDAGAEAAAQAVELGFGTLKLRAGFERTTDQLVARIRAVRAAVGPGPQLRIDVGGAWDLETATERLAVLEPFRIEYVEQPLAAWDLIGHAELRQRVHVPVALDESIDSEGSARAALAEGAADVIIVKPARVGGTAATARIAEMAERAGATVVLGTHFETGVGIASAIRAAAAVRATAGARGRAGSPESAHGLATAGLLVHDLLNVPLAIEKGRMAVPSAISLDESAVDRYAIERFQVQG